MSADESKLDITGASSNGSGGFDVGVVLEINVPFEWTYEGQKLTGRWFKYKTTTREYIKARVVERNEQLARYEDLRRTLMTLQPDDPRTDEMIAECEKLAEVVDRTNYSWLTDAITEWNMVLQGEPVPITAAGFARVPIPILVALDKFLVDSRTDKNPT